MSESKFQKKLTDRLTKQGWYVIKIIQSNKNGIPDLLCLHKNYPCKFIEVKAKNGRVSELQKFRHIEIFKKTGIKTEIVYEE